MDRLEREFQGQVTVQRFDVDEPENAQIQQAYDLRGHPAFALLDSEGTLVNRYFGVVDEGTLQQALQSVSPQ